MWTLISTKERKLYTLIESLYYSDTPMTLKELAEAVGSSQRSMSDYIDEAKIRVNELGGSIRSMLNGYQLKLPDYITIDTFQHQALQSSTPLQLLEQLLLKDKVDGCTLEQKLFISKASLSRIINQLKKELADYGLALEAHPYRIKGDEFLIRRFFTSYYLEAYGYQDWPFKSVDYSEISKLIVSLSQINSIRFETVNVQKFLVFSAVSVIREHHHHTLFNSVLTDDRYEKNAFRHMHSHVTKWIQTVDIPANKKELYSRIYTFYMFYYFRSYTKKTISLNNPDHSKTIEEGLKDIARKFSLPLSDFTHIANKLDDLLYQYSKTDYAKAIDSYLIFKPRDYILLNSYARQYPRFYNLLMNFLDRLYKLYGVDPDKINTEELLYLIISRWDQLSLHLYEQYTTCRLLVYSPLSYRHAENIAKLLRVKLESACILSVYTEPILSKTKLKDYSFDILVSTSSLTLDLEEPIIALHNKYSNHHLQPLLQAIDEAFIKNRQKLQEQHKL